LKKDGTGVKVGHGGTLDPMAEGVLVLGVGRATKIMGYFLSSSKAYVAEGLLGVKTDTLDALGTIESIMDASGITHEKLEETLGLYRGTFLQVPPLYSALKVGGKRMCDLMREGKEVKIRDPREVTVYSLNMNKSVALPKFLIEVECSGGFYVRSLISDIGDQCGVGAHTTKLIRTKQGSFGLDECLYRDDWNIQKFCESIMRCTNKFGGESAIKNIIAEKKKSNVP
jgi:tRNA pseudouridine55 synthase